MKRASGRLIGCLCAAAALSAAADERHFTYSYEAKTLPKGTYEFEQWATRRSGKAEGMFQALDLREEFEYGITDDLTTALYLNFRSKSFFDVPGKTNGTETGPTTLSSEWKYKLTDPSVDVVGSLLYAELTTGSDDDEIEGKIVLSKAAGDFSFAYNLIGEVEREKDERATEYLVSNTLGASVGLAPQVRVGVEAFNEIVFVDSLSDQVANAYFIGPNVHVALDRWWGTVTFAKQVDIQGHTGLDLDEHEKYEVRLIVGVNF